MKIAPTLFCTALAIFLATIAVSKHIPVSTSKITTPLNFKGIDTLEIRSEDIAKISIRDDIASSVSHDARYGEYGDDGEKRIPTHAVKINGNRMLISTDARSYNEYEIVMPSSVQNLIVQQANVTALAGIESMNILVSQSLEWKGNVKTLRVIDSRNYVDAKKECTSGIEIKGGEIGSLFVKTEKGTVELKALDRISSTTLQAGPNASLSIRPVSSIGNVRLEDFPGLINLPESASNQSSEYREYGCGNY
ncbi:MAG: hypothetical protein ACREPB_05675 [Arenimonas sp.]